MISFGLVDDRPLFMEECSDTYFMLDPSDEGYFMQLVANGRPLLADKRLQAAFDSPEPVSIVEAHCVRPIQSIVEEAERIRAPLADILKVAQAVRNTKRLLARQTIGSILWGLREVETSPSSSDRQLVIDRAGSFAAARKHIPIASNCLLDSLAMLSWLGRARCCAILVFGAKLDPFAAHCWVQADDVLLNDRLDSVARFSPVRVVQCSRATL